MSLRLLALLLVLGTCILPASARDDWVEARTPNFTIISTMNPKQVRDFAVELEATRAAMLQVFGGLKERPGRPVTVLALDSSGAISEFVPEEKDAFLRNRKLLFAAADGPEHCYFLARTAGFTASARQEVRRSLATLMVHWSYGWAPQWLQVGLIRFLGDMTVDEKEAFIGTDPDKLFNMVNVLSWIPLEKIVSQPATDFGKDPARSVMEQGECWALVHMLMFSRMPGRSKPLEELFRVLQDGVPPKEALERVVGPLNQANKQLWNYVHAGVLPASRFPSPARVPLAEIPVRKMSAAEAESVHGDYRLQMGDTKLARSFFEHALQLDPNLLDAHNGLADLAILEGRREEAEKHLQASESADANRYLTHYLLGRLLEMPGADSDGDTTAEKHFRRVLELNPLFAPAYSALASLSLKQGRLTGDTLHVARRAVEIEPGRTEFWSVLARALLATKNLENARLAAQFALAAAINKKEKLAADQLLTEISPAPTVAHSPATPEASEKLADAREPTSERPQLRHRTAPPPGSSLRVEGTVLDVTCKGFQLELHLDASGRTVDLRANNYSELVLHDTSRAKDQNFKPCSELRGYRARILYVPDAENPDAGELKEVERLARAESGSGLSPGGL